MYLYGTPRFGGRSKNRIEDTIDIIIKYDKWEFYVYRENQDHLKTSTKTDQLKIKYERKCYNLDNNQSEPAEISAIKAYMNISNVESYEIKDKLNIHDTSHNVNELIKLLHFIPLVSVQFI